MTKAEAYNKGSYLMPVPPVTTLLWTTSDWINFIDARGIWIGVNNE